MSGPWSARETHGLRPNHPTQSEAAESGRVLARRDGDRVLLHGQDGQIREHRDYGEGQTSADEGIVDSVSETVGTVTDLVGDTDRRTDQRESVPYTASRSESSGQGITEDCAA